MKQIIEGRKKCKSNFLTPIVFTDLKSEQVNKIIVPHYDSLSVENIYEEI